MSDQYDPETCITAGELRAMGVPVEQETPDCAWVPRSAVRFGRSTVVAVDGDRFDVESSVEFDRPFKWINVEIHLTRADDGQQRPTCEELPGGPLDGGGYRSVPVNAFGPVQGGQERELAPDVPVRATDAHPGSIYGGTVARASARSEEPVNAPASEPEPACATCPSLVGGGVCCDPGWLNTLGSRHVGSYVSLGGAPADCPRATAGQTWMIDSLNSGLTAAKGPEHGQAVEEVRRASRQRLLALQRTLELNETRAHVRDLEAEVRRLEAMAADLTAERDAAELAAGPLPNGVQEDGLSVTELREAHREARHALRDAGLSSQGAANTLAEMLDAGLWELRQLRGQVGGAMDGQAAVEAERDAALAEKAALERRLSDVRIQLGYDRAAAEVAISGYREVEAERDAALARVAELEGAHE